MTVLVVMGVSGCGKSTVGQALATRLALPFYDADDFHSAANKQKMQVHKMPLTDEDREPWLRELANRIHEWNQGPGAVLACSALKQRYRDLLATGGDITWIFLRGSPELIRSRMVNRSNHFFQPQLLDSQFRDLEVPRQAITVDVSHSVPELVRQIQEQLLGKLHGQLP